MGTIDLSEMREFFRSLKISHPRRFASSLRFISSVDFRELISVAVILSLLLPIPAAAASDQTTTFKIPPVKIPISVKDQRVTMVAFALITLTRKSHGLNILHLQINADLSDLQQNITDLLSAELDKEDHCGDRIAVQHATLTPAEPASVVVVQLHYERYACAKAFGRQETKRVVGGNAVMQMKLTPAVEEDNTKLRLVPEVGPVQADGSLGQLLRSGTLGDMLRERIRKAILNALQKGTDLSATLPPAVQGYAKIKDARFQDAGSGHLLVQLEGEIQISNEQIQELAKQVKERMVEAK